MSNAVLGIDFKLKPRQQAMLEVLSDPACVRMTHDQKAAKSGVSIGTYYRYLRDPNFIQALRLRGLSESLGFSIPIIKRMAADALSGKYMQQKSMLEMSGHLTQTPLIQQFINVERKPAEDTDKRIIDVILGTETAELSTGLSTETHESK